MTGLMPFFMRYLILHSEVKYLMIWSDLMNKKQTQNGRLVLYRTNQLIGTVHNQTKRTSLRKQKRTSPDPLRIPLRSMHIRARKASMIMPAQKTERTTALYSGVMS